MSTSTNSERNATISRATAHEAHTAATTPTPPPPTTAANPSGTTASAASGGSNSSHNNATAAAAVVSQSIKLCLVGSPGDHKEKILRHVLSWTEPTPRSTSSSSRLGTSARDRPNHPNEDLRNNNNNPKKNDEVGEEVGDDEDDSFWQDCLSTVVLDVGGGSSSSSATSQRRAVFTIRNASDVVGVEIVNCFTMVTPCGAVVDEAIIGTTTAATGEGVPQDHPTPAPPIASSSFSSLRCAVCRSGSSRSSSSTSATRGSSSSLGPHRRVTSPRRCDRPFTALLDRVDLASAHAWLILVDVTSLASFETAIALGEALLGAGSAANCRMEGGGRGGTDCLSPYNDDAPSSVHGASSSLANESSSWSGDDELDDRDPLFVGALVAVLDHVDEVGSRNVHHQPPPLSSAGRRRPRVVSREQCKELAQQWQMPLFELTTSSSRLQDTIQSVIAACLSAGRF